MKKYKKKIAVALIAGIFSSNVLAATATQTPSMTAGGMQVPTMSPLTTISPDDASVIAMQRYNKPCYKEVMANLNSNYLNSRGITRQKDYEALVGGVVSRVPKSSSSLDCFQQAMRNIKSLMNTINGILGMFSGQMDIGALLSQITNMVLNAACQEVNQVTGAITGSLTNPVNSTINGTVGSVLSTSVGAGSYNTSVGTILNATNSSSSATPVNVVSGSVSSVNNTVGAVSDTFNSAQSTGSSLLNKILDSNPF